MTYFEAVPNENGLNPLPSNPCQLLDFHLLSLVDGQSYAAATGNREVLAVILGGNGTFQVNEHRQRLFRQTPFRLHPLPD